MGEADRSAARLGAPLSRILHDAAQRAQRYLDRLEERSVAPAPDALQAMAELSSPLQAAGVDPAQVLEELDRYGSPATIGCAGGRYFGFVTGGTLPAALGAGVLAAAWDQNACLEVASPVAAELEKICRGWLVSLLGLPAGTEAGFTTGATMANFAGIAAARHALLKAQGWDVEAQGLFGAPPVDVIVGEEVHASLLKALNLVGFGRERVIRVPADDQGRMLAARIPRIERPTLICAQAGNVNSGAFDPVGEAVDRAAGTASSTWVHVDGAFGLWAMASPRYRGLAEGTERADSWAVDAHKWLNVPYDSGLVFVRETENLQAAMSATASYLIEGETRDPLRYVPEMSRRARAVEIWAALRSLGIDGVASMVDRCCAYARTLAAGLQAAGHEVLNDVCLNQVVVAFGSAERTERTMAAIQRDGTCWCGGTVWKGRTAMRISVSSWATTERDIERSLQAILHAADVS